MGKKVVLLIDDDPMSVIYSTLDISKQNPKNEILTFNNGPAALDCLTKKDTKLPDVIFLDLNMPGMNGWDFLAEYEKTTLNIDIIIVTSSDELLDKERCKNFQIIKEYLVKPISVKSISPYFDRNS